MMRQPLVRQHKRLIVVEGLDEKCLIEELIKIDGHSGCDILSSDGEGNLGNTCRAAVKSSGPAVESLLIVRDAETSAISAMQSTQTLLKTLGFPSPDGNMSVVSDNGRRGGMAILPDGRLSGSIESLCLWSVKDHPIMSCVTQYFDCVSSHHSIASEDHRLDKARCQAFLSAFTADRVVHRCGLGLKRQLFDLSHDVFAPCRKLLGEFCN